MLGRAAGFVAAAYALGVNSILLPPGVNSLDDSLSFTPEAAKSQVVRIPCSECAFSTKSAHEESPEGSDEVFRIEGGASDLLLDFSTSDDGRRLDLNGATIYPPLEWSRDTLAVVYQVPTAGENGLEMPLEVTSSGLMTDLEEPAAPQDEETSLVTIRYAIYGLRKQLMQLPTVKIDLLKTGGELHIMNAEVVKTDAPIAPERPHHGPPPGFRPPFGGPPSFNPGPQPEMTNAKECNTLPAPVCRFKHMLEAKIAHMRHRRPCPGEMGPPHSHGGPPARFGPPFKHGERPHPSHHGRPHHMRPWHGRHHGHHRHGHHHWAGAFVRGFVAVLIPVIAGISVGLAVSLMGLVIGRLISWGWARFARKQKNGSGGAMREAADVEEGKGLILADEEADEDDDEVPPAYEDAPAYEVAADEKFFY